jgi:hypothetical protein
MQLFLFIHLGVEDPQISKVPPPFATKLMLQLIDLFLSVNTTVTLFPDAFLEDGAVIDDKVLGRGCGVNMVVILLIFTVFIQMPLMSLFFSFFLELRTSSMTALAITEL